MHGPLPTLTTREPLQERSRPFSRRRRKHRAPSTTLPSSRKASTRTPSWTIVQRARTSTQMATSPFVSPHVSERISRPKATRLLTAIQGTMLRLPRLKPGSARSWVSDLLRIALSYADPPRAGLGGCGLFAMIESNDLVDAMIEAC